MARNWQDRGTITYRPDETQPYVAEIDVFNKRRQRAFETRSQAECWIACVAMLAGEDEDESVMSYLQRWLQIRSPNAPSDWEGQLDRLKVWNTGIKPLRASTHTIYSGAINRHIAAHISPELRMSQVQQRDLDELLGRCASAGLSGRPLQIIRNMLTSAFGEAQKIGLISNNPAKGLSVPGMPQAEVTLSPEELRRLILAVQGTMLEVAVPFVAYTRIRKGELLALRCSDVDWDNQTLRVGGRVVRTESRQNLVAPKTLGDIREIALDERTSELLKRQQALVSAWREQAGDCWSDHGLVFPSCNGAPLENDVVRHIFKRALVQADLPANITWHSLRHMGFTPM